MRILAQKPPRYLNGQCHKRWGVLLSPPAKINIGQVLESDFDFAVDNGAFVGFDQKRFLRLLDKLTRQPLFVVVPDSVGNKAETLRLFDIWEPIISRQGFSSAFVIQDGMTFEDLPTVDYYFLGGSLAFKVSDQARKICQRLKGKYLHVGRVNSFSLLKISAYDLRADSVDGLQFSKYLTSELPKANNFLDRITSQPAFDYARQG